MNAIAPTPLLANRPEPISPELLRSLLAEDHAALLKRRDELLAAVARFPRNEKGGFVVVSDETSGRAGDFVKQLDACCKAAEAQRVAAKEPHLANGRAVDGFFKTISDPVAAPSRDIKAAITSYLRAKEDRERRAREEAARIAREEFERHEAALMASAEVLPNLEGEAALDTTLRAQAQAEDATRAASASPAELSRVRGDYGSVASLRTTWAHEINDIALVPMEMLRPYLAPAAIQQALRSLVNMLTADLKPGSPAPVIPGVRIFEQKNAVVR